RSGADGAVKQGRPAAGRTRQGGRRRARRVRPGRLSIPRTCSGAGRGRARGRPGVLSAAAEIHWKSISMARDRTVSSQGLDLQERVVEINRVAKVVKG